MIKRVTSLLCAAVLSASFAVGNIASAAVPIPDSPAHEYARNCNSILSVSGTTATCKSNVVGFPGRTTKIVINQTLQQKGSSGNWDYVYSWYDTFNDSSVLFTNTKSSLSSGTYRVKTVATVYEGTENETITEYSAEKIIWKTMANIFQVYWKI